MADVIPYKEITRYYADILHNIYEEIHAVTPVEYGDGLCDLKYPPEHLNAYGWLQKAEWRLSDVSHMEKYYNENGFEHFGLECLHDVKTRIEHYLQNTDWEYTEKVTEYHKYDTIVDQRMELINEPGHHDYWDYFHKQQHLENYKTYLKLDIDWVKNHAEDLHYTLSEHGGGTEKRLLNREKLLEKVEKIQELIEELQPEYEEIPKPKIKD